MNITGNTQAQLDQTKAGDTFILDGVWNCKTQGKLHIREPIHLMGAGSMRQYGKGWQDRYGDTFIDNHHEGAEEAIFYDIPSDNETHGIIIRDLTIKHTSPTHHAIRMRRTPAAVLQRIYIDSTWGRGGIFFDDYTYFMKCRDVTIRDFTDTGVRIVGTGNDYAFYNCDIASRRRSGQENTAKSGIHCVNTGLTVYQGCINVENDNRDGVGIQLMHDRSLRPNASGQALIYGVYAENADIAVHIDATPGYQYDTAMIVYPMWSMRTHRGFTRGVEVVRGKNVYINSPRVPYWDEIGTLAHFYPDSSDCCIEDKTHDISGLVLDDGSNNRVVFH